MSLLPTEPGPGSLRISRRQISDDSVTITLEVNTVTTPRRRVDSYEFAIMPQVIQPLSKLTSPLDLTLQTSTLYNITLTSVNCFGRTTAQKQIGKYVINTNEPVTVFCYCILRGRIKGSGCAVLVIQNGL